MRSNRFLRLVATGCLLFAAGCFPEEDEPSTLFDVEDAAARVEDDAAPADDAAIEQSEADAADAQPAEAEGGGDEPPPGCVPETDEELCLRQNKTCGTFSSNDNCGNWRTIDDCGFGVVCQAPLICGWCNRCCLQETNTDFCARLGATCGNLTAQDNCGGWRTVATCGQCAGGEACGGGGTPNVCGCDPDGGACDGGAPADGGVDGD
jgi:hypothetical protein